MSASGRERPEEPALVEVVGTQDRVAEMGGDLGEVLADRRLVAVPAEVPERHAHVEQVIEECVGQDGIAAARADRREIAADDAAARPRERDLTGIVGGRPEPLRGQEVAGP